mmetsp:Transcript_8786/g.31005  ORF Transcript_8786/g.31005 Transcript_8786/m.31005 type:complete len:259 (-) Transcript_8786:355-1131(-)
MINRLPRMITRISRIVEGPRRAPRAQARRSRRASRRQGPDKSPPTGAANARRVAQSRKPGPQQRGQPESGEAAVCGASAARRRIGRTGGGLERRAAGFLGREPEERSARFPNPASRTLFNLSESNFSDSQASQMPKRSGPALALNPARRSGPSEVVAKGLGPWQASSPSCRNSRDRRGRAVSRRDKKGRLQGPSRTGKVVRRKSRVFLGRPFSDGLGPSQGFRGPGRNPRTLPCVRTIRLKREAPKRTAEGPYRPTGA